MNFKTQLLKFLYGFLLIISGYPIEGKAQSEACFQFLGDSVGCTPLTVRVRSCADAGAIVSFFFEWSPGSTTYVTMPPGVTDTSYTYSVPGTYILYQLRGGNQFVQRIVKVFSQDARPVFTWRTCLDTLTIQFADSVFNRFLFTPGDGGGSQIINGGTAQFKYKYNFAGTKATYIFRIKGVLPSTCSQETLTDTVTLYKINNPPEADSLIGSDTLTYKSRLKTRADEPYLIETRADTNWETLVKSSSPNDNPAQINSFVLSAVVQGQKIRAATRTDCGDTLAAPDWTIIWPRATPDNQKITLSWPLIPIPDLVQFEVLRNGVRLKVINNPLDTSLVDSSDLVCGQNYCYQFLIRRQVAGHPGKLVYLSAPICSQAVSNQAPPALEGLTASVRSNGIEVNGKIPAQGKSFSIFRKEKEDGEFSLLKVITGLPYLDEDADFKNRAYCYRVQYTDICNNLSIISDSVCPVWLRVTELTDARFQFVWTRMEGWKGGLERYELVRTTPQDSPVFYQMAKAQSHNMEGRDKTRQRVFYTIRSYANETDLYPTSFSNTVEIVQKPKLRFPEIFTPNDDRINDKFSCASLFLTNFEMKIFNPWGEVVFYSDRVTEGWNGKIDSKPAPVGIYAYWAKGTDEEGNDLEIRGYFTLVR